MKNENTQLVKNENVLPLQAIDLNSGLLPDLDDATELPLDLMSDYWTPTTPGEQKRVYFDCIRERAVKDQQNPDIIIELPCAYFYEKINGEVKTVSNGSKRLVGVIESNNIPRGTPLMITYLGKKRNATNSFSSDQWSVKPLIINK